MTFFHLKQLWIVLALLVMFISLENYTQVNANNNISIEQEEVLSNIDVYLPKNIEINENISFIEDQIRKEGITLLARENIGESIDGFLLLEWLEIISVNVVSETYNPLTHTLNTIINVEAEVGIWDEFILSRDKAKLELDCVVVMNELHQVVALVPNRLFKWTPELMNNTTWIKRMPYYPTIPVNLEEKIVGQVTLWVEEKQVKWCTPDQYVYTTPYKEHIVSIDVQDITIESVPSSTLNHLVFDILIDSEVLLKNFQIQHYTYRYQIGMIEGEIMWIKFIDAHEID